MDKTLELLVKAVADTKSAFDSTFTANAKCNDGSLTHHAAYHAWFMASQSLNRYLKEQDND